MKRVFLSIPFKSMNKEMEEKICYYTDKISHYFRVVRHEDAEVIHSYYIDADGGNSKLYGFSQAIFLMGMCDYVCMVDDWVHAIGCIIERDIALAYDVPVLYEGEDF